MRMLLPVLVVILSPFAGAEEKTCVVNGMECQNCVEMITKDVCTDRYAKCTVELTDRVKHLGRIHVATKDPAGSVDMKAMEVAVGKLNYSLGACSVGATRKR